MNLDDQDWREMASTETFRRRLAVTAMVYALAMAVSLVVCVFGILWGVSVVEDILGCDSETVTRDC